MYIILESQKDNAGIVVLTPSETYATEPQAESAYHQKLASAAISEVPVHSVALLNDTLDMIKKQTYYHG